MVIVSLVAALGAVASTWRWQDGALAGFVCVVYATLLWAGRDDLRTGSTAAEKTVWMVRGAGVLAVLSAAVYQVCVPESRLVLTVVSQWLLAAFLLLTGRWLVSAAAIITVFYLSGPVDNWPVQNWPELACALTACLLTLVCYRRGQARVQEQQMAEHAEEKERLAAELAARKIELEAARALADPQRILDARGEMDGLWEWQLKRDRMYFSPRWRALLGYSEKGEYGSPEDWFNLIHPCDLDEVWKRLGDLLNGRAPHFECEHRIRQKDGSYRWVLSHAALVRTGDGSPERVAGSQTDIKRMKNYEAQLVHDATHDRLTGLPNRQYLLERLAEQFFRKRCNQSYLFGIAFLDLDGFKLINDSLGHQVGDQLLIEVADRLKRAVRQTDVVARIGGDEFVVLMPGLRDEFQPVRLAEDIQKAIRGKVTLGGKEVSTAASIGIATASEPDLAADDLLRHADIAMYHAKDGGRGQIKCFDRKMHEQSAKHFGLQHALGSAIENQEFQLFYQPIVSLDSGKIRGAEALIRWPRPGGDSCPAEFIRVAENAGLIDPIGAWVLEEACRQNKAWQDAGMPPIKVSVNVSPRQLSHPEFSRNVRGILERTGLAPEWLQLEITENALVDWRSATPLPLDDISDLGVRIAIDDFGTGYSSLSYLRRLACHVLKIDRSFVSDVTSAPKAAAVARSIIHLGHNLDLQVVAEGVETLDQVSFLREHGCDEIQGFVVCRPTSSLVFSRLLKNGWNTGASPLSIDWLERLSSSDPGSPPDFSETGRLLAAVAGQTGGASRSESESPPRQFHFDYGEESADAYAEVITSA